MKPSVLLSGLLAGIPRREQRQAMARLCEQGFITCTRGRAGDRNASYALAWLPLDEPRKYSDEVLERHGQNMRRLKAKGRSEGGRG
jgi:transcription initiation factor IIE alpha subunit